MKGIDETDIVGKGERCSVESRVQYSFVASAYNPFQTIRSVFGGLTLGLPTEILHLGGTRLHLTVDL